MLHAGVSGWRCGPTTASPSGRRRARRGRGRRGRARGLDRVSFLCRTPLKESAGRRPSRQQGLLRSPCRPRWVRRRPKRIVVGCRQSPPAAGAAIDGGDGCRNTSDESPRRSRKVVNPHMWPVCAKIAIVSGGEKEPTQDFPCRARAHPRQHLPCGARAHPNRHPDEEGAFHPPARIRYKPLPKAFDPRRYITSEEGLGGTRIKDRHAPV